MTESDILNRLLTNAGPVTYAYVDGPAAVPQVEEESRHRAVADRAREAGAPADDVEALSAALEDSTGLPSPSARYIVVRGGYVEYDASFDGARLGSEIVGHGPVPPVLPAVRHRSSTRRYLVVEANREGAEIRLERAGHPTAESVEEIEGRTDSMKKVQAGGWSHARYQRHTEEIWKSNQAEVAEGVDRQVRESRPDFVIVSGDVRARQLLVDGLGVDARELVIEVDVHTRAEGSDDSALDDAIAERLESDRRDEVAAALDRAATDGGSGGVHGWAMLVEAVQQAQVDTIVLDARSLDDEELYAALDGPPWVSAAADGSFDAEIVGSVPRAEAVARAAVLTGAQVLVREDEPIAEDEPRTERPVEEPVAVLRWRNAPA